MSNNLNLKIVEIRKKTGGLGKEHLTSDALATLSNEDIELWLSEIAFAAGMEMIPGALETESALKEELRKRKLKDPASLNELLEKLNENIQEKQNDLEVLLSKKQVVENQLKEITNGKQSMKLKAESIKNEDR